MKKKVENLKKMNFDDLQITLTELTEKIKKAKASPFDKAKTIHSVGTLIVKGCVAQQNYFKFTGQKEEISFWEKPKTEE